MNEFLETMLDRLGDYLDFMFGSDGGFGTVFGLTFLMLVWLASGALASAAAERKLRNGLLHFLAGLAVPVVYPLGAVLFMRRPKRWRKDEDDRQEKEDDLMRIDGPPPVADNQRKRKGAGPGRVSEDSLATHSSVYNRAYFKSICFDDSGRSRGPFSLVVEGVELRIERIVEPMEEVVCVETVNADGKQQTLRIPYKRVESCREI